MTLEQIHEADGTCVSHTSIWRKRFPGRRYSKFKDLEAGECLVSSRNSKKPGVIGAARTRGKAVKDQA